jgi:ABC-type transporter MlaC component
MLQCIECKIHSGAAFLMRSIAKTPNRHAFSIPWFDHRPEIDVVPSNAGRDHRRTDGLATPSTDPGQFIVEFLAQLSKLNQIHIGDEQDRRHRLGTLLDRTLDLKIIGDFLLASNGPIRASQERQTFDRYLRCYLIDRIRAAIGSLSPRRLRVIDHYRDGVAAVVVTELTFSLFSLRFRWIVVDKPGGWRVCNLVIEEIDLAMLLREKLSA